jgi:hypothetical protein
MSSLLFLLYAYSVCCDRTTLITNVGQANSPSIMLLHKKNNINIKTKIKPLQKTKKRYRHKRQKTKQIKK